MDGQDCKSHRNLLGPSWRWCPTEEHLFQKARAQTAALQVVTLSNLKAIITRHSCALYTHLHLPMITITDEKTMFNIVLEKNNESRFVMMTYFPLTKAVILTHLLVSQVWSFTIVIHFRCLCLLSSALQYRQCWKQALLRYGISLDSWMTSIQEASISLYLTP